MESSHRSLDSICDYYIPFGAGSLPRMVSVDRSVSVLSVQGLPESGSLECQISCSDHDDPLHISKVSSKAFLIKPEIKTDRPSQRDFPPSNDRHSAPACSNEAVCAISFCFRSAMVRIRNVLRAADYTLAAVHLQARYAFTRKDQASQANLRRPHCSKNRRRHAGL